MSTSFLAAASVRITDAEPTPEPLVDTSLHIAASDEAIEKPDLDERKYRHLRLNNKLQIMLVSDPACDYAAAAMDVSVGSASDPDELPGLAHFLEHMLFLGTEKYPREDAYQNYLEQHGGSSNAFTSHENTTYFFDVQHGFLPGALDRFAQFFLCPLFTDSATEREMKAVDSENSKNLQSDAWRLQQLHKWAADPKHPWSRFNTGSLETLSDKPASHVKLELSPRAAVAGSSSGVSAALSARFTPALIVRRALIDFHAKHYSANLMSLAVLGRQSLEELEQLVVPLFAAVPNLDAPLPSWPHAPYPDERLRRHFKVVPVKDFSSLTVCWPLPSIRQQYLSKPYRYISHILGHEGEGSLLSLLKDKGWADQLVAGETRSHSDFATFEVTMELTEAANAHADEIVALVFSCLALVRDRPPVDWVFEEMRDLGAVSFRFRDTIEPSSAVLALVATMQLHPPKHALSAPFIFSDFSDFAAKEVHALLGLLTPQRACVVHVAKEHEGKAVRREPWYGTAFTVDAIVPELLRTCTAAAADPALRWPEPNPFIPTDFALVCDQPDETKSAQSSSQRPATEGRNPTCISPSLIREDGLAKLWHKTDATFRRPKTNVWLEVIAPAAYSSPAAACLTRLFFRLVTDELTEFAYPAECAGLAYSVSNSTLGLRLMVSGYNHKLPLLLKRVLAKVASPALDPERFTVQRDLQLKEYANFFKGAPYSLARYATSHLLELARWHLLEYIDFIQSDECSHESLRGFVSTVLLKQVHMSVLCHGNTGRAQSLALVDEAAQALGSKALGLSQLPTPRLLQLPADVEVVYRLHPSVFAAHHLSLLNMEERNSAIELTLQGGLDERPASMYLEFLTQILSHPAYEQLRTTEQLGYLVNLGQRYDLGVVGLRVIVQSANHDAAYLDARVEAFLATVPKLLADLAPSEFANHKDAILKAKLEAPKTLRQESAIYWNEIAQGTYDFQRDAVDAKVVEKVTQQDIIEYWGKVFDASATGRRKISTHVYASHLTMPPKLAKGVNGRAMQYVEGLDAVLEYKRTLAAFPAAPRCDRQ